MFPKWAWSGSRKQFLHCGLKKFRHSNSSVYRWYTQLDRRRFVYDTYKTMKATRMRHGWVYMYITHRLTLTLQLRNFNLFRTCRTSSFCTVAWQLARYQLTQRIARSLGNSWASCSFAYRLGQAYLTSFYRAMLCIRGTSHGPVSVSVCLSVTSWSSTKTAKRRITQTTPESLVFWWQRFPRNSTGVTPYEGAEWRWGGSKSTTFDK